jgi:hypothetical protein
MKQGFDRDCELFYIAMTIVRNAERNGFIIKLKEIEKDRFILEVK